MNTPLTVSTRLSIQNVGNSTESRVKAVCTVYYLHKEILLMIVNYCKLIENNIHELTCKLTARTSDKSVSKVGNEVACEVTPVFVIVYHIP